MVLETIFSMYTLHPLKDLQQTVPKAIEVKQGSCKLKLWRTVLLVEDLSSELMLHLDCQAGTSVR